MVFKHGSNQLALGKIRHQYFNARYCFQRNGHPNNLVQRIWQHQEGLAEGFTKKYKVHPLVYDEMHSDVYEAITREKRIKKWNRQWKINLIEQKKPSGLICASDYFDGWLPACAAGQVFCHVQSDCGYKYADGMVLYCTAQRAGQRLSLRLSFRIQRDSMNRESAQSYHRNKSPFAIASLITRDCDLLRDTQ